MSKICLKCNSENIIPRVRITDHHDSFVDEGFSLVIDEKPIAFIISQKVYSKVAAKVCGDCGYIEFYAEKPGTLFQAYQNNVNEARKRLK